MTIWAAPSGLARRAWRRKLAGDSTAISGVTLRPMPRFFFETDAPTPCPIEFDGAADVLAAFLSFAFATRYGAQHPLSALALHLRATYKIDMKPLTFFADRNAVDDADRADLDAAWQDAASLAETLRRVVEAMESEDDRSPQMTQETPDLLPRLRDLRDMAAWAAEHDARSRMTFEL